MFIGLLHRLRNKCWMVLHRCVLEVRLAQLRAPGVRADGMKLPRDGNVGPVPPCASFLEYAQRASERLGLR